MPLVDTPILDVTQSDNIALAGRILQKNGLVAFPSETVYGLGALGLNKIAVEKIFTAKKRPSNNPLILHVKNNAKALELFDFSFCLDPKLARSYFDLLAQNFWPGPLTLVCFKNKKVPDITTANLNKVAVRVPNHPIAKALLELVDEPIAAPSANASQRPSSTTAYHVKQTLNGKLDAILDGGACLHGLESTVVDISSNPPTMLRMGAISLDTLLQVIPKLKWREAGCETHDSSGSPGLVSKHYAPLIEKIELGEICDIEKHWKSNASLLVKQSSKIKLEKKLGTRPDNNGLLIALPDDEFQYARKLYAALYELETSSAKHLIIENVCSKKRANLFLSVKDRLIRATTK